MSADDTNLAWTLLTQSMFALKSIFNLNCPGQPNQLLLARKPYKSTFGFANFMKSHHTLLGGFSLTRKVANQLIIFEYHRHSENPIDNKQRVVAEHIDI